MRLALTAALACAAPLVCAAPASAQSWQYTPDGWAFQQGTPQVQQQYQPPQYQGYYGVPQGYGQPVMPNPPRVVIVPVPSHEGRGRDRDREDTFPRTNEEVRRYWRDRERERSR